jgi:hypothetical protein
VENKDNGDQVRRWPNDLFYHVNSEERICLLVRLAVEAGPRWLGLSRAQARQKCPLLG